MKGKKLPKPKRVIRNVSFDFKRGRRNKLSRNMERREEQQGPCGTVCLTCGRDMELVERDGTTIYVQCPIHKRIHHVKVWEVPRSKRHLYF